MFCVVHLLGWEGYVKVRGIFRGAVFIRWMTNLILLVGDYSPYASAVKAKIKFHDDITLKSEGCFADNPSERDMSHHVVHYTAASLSPLSCLTSCIRLGYAYAGLQGGSECWCSESFGSHGQGSSCSSHCYGNGKEGYVTGAIGTVSGVLHLTTACGGVSANSVYSNAASPSLYSSYSVAPSDAVFVRGIEGESCTSACQRSSSKLQCNEALFPLIHRSCEKLRHILGCQQCQEETDVERGFATRNIKTEKENSFNIFDSH